MAEKNIKMRRKNADGSFDEFYPHTKVKNVLLENGQPITTDYVRQPGYAVTAGTGNAYTVTTDPAPTSYVDGMGIVIRANRANTGAATLKWGALAAVPIVDARGNALTSGKIQNGARLSLRYSSLAGNFQLQGEGSEERKGHVTAQSISRSGNTLRMRPQQGDYPGDAANSVQWSEPNWIAANILKDKSIFGLLGTLEPKHVANGQVTSSSSTTYFARGNGTSVSFYYVQVSGLDFIPEIIILSGSIVYDIAFSRTSDYLYYESANYYSSILVASGGYQTEIRMTSPAYVDARGFLLPVSKNQNFKWIAFG